MADVKLRRKSWCKHAGEYEKIVERLDNARVQEDQENSSFGDLAGSSESGNSTGTLGKAMEVLDIVALSDEPLRFTDILNQVDYPRGTLHRHLSNLTEEGLISVNPENSYAPGVRLLKLAARAWSKNSFRTIAEPHIRHLHDITGETIHLGLLSDLEVIYIDKLESRQSVRMHSQVGNASPLYCTGIGKAMLAMLPAEDCKTRADRFQFFRHTPTTLNTPRKLLKEIAVIRETGVSHDREEHEPGIYCVAAALDCGERGPIAGLSITAPAFRIDEKIIASWETLVSETVGAIKHDMDERLGPRSNE